MGSEKILRPTKFWDQKVFDKAKMSVPKKFGFEHFWVLKNLGSKTKFGSENIFGPKTFRA